MITVYRIQNKHGRGPFIPGFSHKWLDEEIKEERVLTPWYEEFKELNLIILPDVYYGCGCKDIEQLRRWFTESEYRRLKEYGFMAVSLKVEKILAESEIQCVFRKSKPLFKGVNVIKLYN